jgi:hypothetical protein
MYYLNTTAVKFVTHGRFAVQDIRARGIYYPEYNALVSEHILTYKVRGTSAPPPQ